VKLHLVRHAAPRVDSAVPPWEWGLQSAATDATGRLRASSLLPATARWVSSTEPKAMQTAEQLTAGRVVADDRLREAVRPPEFLDTEEFRRRVLRSFQCADEPSAVGWEPLAATRHRVLAATEEALQDAAGQEVVLVGHGTALTMLVSALVDRPPDVAAWQAMLFPDHCALWLPNPQARPLKGDLVRPWGAWAA
jgi:broad specificity phosphatase PhoE